MTPLQSAPGSQAPGMLAASAGAMDRDVHIRSEQGQLLHRRSKTSTLLPTTTISQGSLHGQFVQAHSRRTSLQPVNVGPGVGTGYDSEGVGGFQQFNVRDAATPLNVDSLRIIGNEKQVYNGRVTGVATQQIPMRGDQACVQLKKPPTSFERSRYYASYRRNLSPIYGEQPMQDTLRGCTRSDLMGGAGLVGGTAAGGYTVSQPWLRYKQGGFAGPSPGLRPELVPNPYRTLRRITNL
jgi:hypothetical protein